MTNKKKVGRPRKPDKAEKKITVAVTDEEREEYNELSEYHEKSLARIIKDYLNRSVKKMRREQK